MGLVVAAPCTDDRADSMTAGKRLSTDEPLTEHDFAERLDKAALRLMRIMWDARRLELMEPIKSSRYLTNIVYALRAEMDLWDIDPQPLREEPPSDSTVT